MRTANRCLPEKTDALKKAEEHLLRATTERSFYNSKVVECRQVLSELGITDLLQPGNDVPDSSSDFEVNMMSLLCEISRASNVCAQYFLSGTRII
jgi:hypothetical protein